MKPLLRHIVAVVALSPAVGLAHTHLVRSSPADNAVLDKAPASATLAFAEPVTLTAVKIESTEGVKASVQSLPAKPTAEATMALPALAPGHYKLRWRATGDDGHIMSGEIHFSVRAPGGH
jgi:copper resistance protein C